MSATQSPFDALTPTELRVLRACLGRTSNEAATIVGCQPGTVEKHVASARRKLNAPSKNVAARMLWEFEHAQKLGSELSPISFPDSGLADDPVGIPPAGTDRVAEQRFIYEAPLDPAISDEPKGTPSLDLQLTRFTLLIAAVTLLILALGTVDTATPLFDRLARFVLRYVWY